MSAKLINWRRIMIRWKALLLAFLWPFFFVNLFAQNQRNSIFSGEINVGDAMPDISLEITDGKNKELRLFSTFRGKIVILEFWNTWCSSCLAEFPHLEMLQMKFGDRLQIILVNIQESQEQINQRLGISYLQKYKFPKLLSIVGDTILEQFFPHPYSGHTVWIDGNGIVRIKGSSLNNNEEKVNDLLAGKEITYISDGKPYLITDKPLYTVGLGEGSSQTQILSFFRKFDEIYGPGGGTVENVIDTISHTVRNTYMNVDLTWLLSKAFKDFFRDANLQAVYADVNNKWPRILLLVEDTLKYTNNFIPSERHTDKQFRNTHFCYEQILPVRVSEEQRCLLMQEDLKRFFNTYYNAELNIERHRISCYQLVSTDSSKLAGFARSDVSEKWEHIIENGRKMIRVKNVYLKTIIGILVSNVLPKQAILLNETGFKEDKRVDMIVPEEVSSFQQLINILHFYGLSIQEDERYLPMLVIREKKQARYNHISPL